MLTVKRSDRVVFSRIAGFSAGLLALFLPEVRHRGRTPVRCMTGLLALFLLVVAASCSAAPAQNATLPTNPRQAASQALPVWEGRGYGLNATIKPQRSTNTPNNLLLNAMYRSDGQVTRFAIFFPQGSKLGQCERIGAQVQCSSANFPYAQTLVQTAFSALDEIFTLLQTSNPSTTLSYNFTPSNGPFVLEITITGYQVKP